MPPGSSLDSASHLRDSLRSSGAWRHLPSPRISPNVTAMRIITCEGVHAAMDPLVPHCMPGSMKEGSWVVVPHVVR